MDNVIERAQQLMFRVDLANLEPNCPLPHEVASMIGELTKAIQLQWELLRSVQFALNYYGDPYLYCDPVIPSDPLLDGGLRARTALYLMKRCSSLSGSDAVLNGARL
jgi:hypothetical protein